MLFKKSIDNSVSKRKKQSNKYQQHRYKLGKREVLVQGYEPQALDYLVKYFPPEKIYTEKEMDFKVRYKYRKKHRDYYPDMLIPSCKLVIEVKSWHTLGLNNRTHRGWSMTCAKAIACHTKGYKFCLLLMDGQGKRYRMPKRWPYMSKSECLSEIHKLNPVKSWA